MISKTESIIKLKCPRCRKGNLFIFPGLFRFKDILEMHENCSNCALNYELEPGFWLGALWTSYPIIVIIELPFLLFAILSSTVNLVLIFSLMILSMLIFYPLILRLGRSLWIHILISKMKQ
jgi:uncharacterized protein (DUF983 family)